MRGIALVLVLALASACSSGGGEDVAPVPPRPRDVRLDGVDPCSLLSDQQRAELGLDGKPSADTKPSRLFGGDLPLCSISGYRPVAVSVGVGVVTTAGIELFSSDQVDAMVRGISVEGYPAVVAEPARFDHFCDVAVDVAPGQLLDIHYSDGGGSPQVSRPELCRNAQTVATAAMQTLLAR